VLVDGFEIDVEELELLVIEVKVSLLGVLTGVLVVDAAAITVIGMGIHALQTEPFQ